MRYYFVLLCIVCSPLVALSQEGIGIDPPSMKWRQIQTATGKIIFPAEMDSITLQAAHLLNMMNAHDSSILGQKEMQKIPVILQNQSIFPAGFSTPAPWRLELYPVAPQNQFLGPTPWLNALTIHEFRHAQQFSAANRGFTRVPEVLMGETGWLLYTLATQPLWFREGDAVLMETVGTQAGRGRLPSFNAEYRALRLSGYDWSYDKGTWISYKDYVPNPYRIGYYMLSFARRHYGEKVWADVLKDTYTKRFPFYPFTFSLRKHTGMTPRKLYQNTLHELDSIYHATDTALSLTSSVAVTKEPDVFTSYRFAHFINDTEVVAYKSGFRDIGSLVSVNEKEKDKELVNYGIYTTDHISVRAAGQLLTWAVADYDPRWINRNYSNIITYNTAIHKYKKLTSKQRFFSPAPSYDGKEIVAVEITTMQKYRLVILDAQTGKVLRTLPNPNNTFYTQPCWTHDNQNIVAVTSGLQGNSLQLINARSGEVKTLIGDIPKVIERPYESNGKIYFSAGLGSISNIYAIDVNGGAVYEVTSTRFGANDPAVSPDGKKLIYSEYTAKGYKLSTTPLNQDKWEKVSLMQKADIQFHEPVMVQEGDMQIAAEIPDTIASKPYHAGLAGLFHIYGWTPLPNVPEYGLEFYTRNLMSTVTGTYGAAYHTKEGILRTYGRLTYAYLYPVFNLEAATSARRSAILTGKDVGITRSDASWRENTYSLGFDIPWQQTHKAYLVKTDLGAAYKHYQINHFTPSNFTALPDFSAIEANMTFSRLIEKARQHVKPRWGQQLNLQYQKGISSMAYQPQRLFINGRLYFPGVAKTHSFNIEGAWQKQSIINSYLYISDYLPARGYKLLPAGLAYKAAFNYELPLWYPDIAAGPVAFFQRVRANFFYDHSAQQVYAGASMNNFSSAGAELLFDVRLFRLFQMAIGLQYSYKMDEPIPGQRNYFTLVVPSFELLN